MANSVMSDYSLEMTGKDVDKLDEARALIPAGTRINVTFLGNEDLEMRVSASRAVKDWGFTPVPHISARRLKSQEMLEEFLGRLQADGTSENVFVVGGDPTTPEGPYADSHEVILSGVLPDYGVKHVSVSGYPEGHPDIPHDALWKAIRDKDQTLKTAGLPGTVITQFGFDVDPVITWIEEVRGHGIELPIRIGVPGPAGIKRLLSYAKRFGVASSAGIAKKYGMSITNLMGTAGPDKFIRELEERYEPARHGEVKLHFYTFGGLKATQEWINQFEAKSLSR